MSAKIKLLIADDHAVVREGVKHVVKAERDMKVVAEASSGRQAIERARAAVPDVAIVDISRGELQGAEVTRQLRRQSPATKVLAFTVHEDRAHLQALLEAGAAGYVLKRRSTDDLLRAIRVIAEGGTYVDPDVAGQLVRTLVGARGEADRRPETLSDRETEVLRLIAHGYSNKEIAARLGVSVKTIETYKSRGMEKLELRSRVDLVRHATEHGWLHAHA